MYRYNLLVCVSTYQVSKHGLLQHCRETGLKKENQAQDKDIRKGSMTHQDEGRIEVTIYEDDIVVRGPSHVIRGIREIDIPTILSRVFCTSILSRVFCTSIF